MLTADELLVEGETLIGDYQVQIARWRDNVWTPTLPTLYMILTNYRMILQPHSRKRHEPAIIPKRYISKVEELKMDFRRGVVLHLPTGHIVGMFIGDDPQRQVLRSLRATFVPPSPVIFRPEIDLQNLNKLIEFLDNLK